jgi:hypothetical protein
LFGAMVGDGRMPQPKKINARLVWDRRSLDDAFDALPEREGPNPWDAIQCAANGGTAQ